MRSVRSETLARVAEGIGLGQHLHISRAEADQGGRGSRNLLADACEAVIAALFLDGGFDVARRFVERHWQPLLAEQSEPPQDAKTALQEWAQGQGLPLPAYRLVASEGPAHDPRLRHRSQPAGPRGGTRARALAPRGGIGCCRRPAAPAER